MKYKVTEVFLDDGNIDIIFDDLIDEPSFNIIFELLLSIENVRVIKEMSDENGKKCLLSNGIIDFVLIYSTDTFVWNYIYSIKGENHYLLKELLKEKFEFREV